MPQDDNLLNANYQFFPRGYEMGEEGTRGGEEGDDDDDQGGGGGRGSGDGEGNGGGGGGGDTEMKEEPVEPTAMGEGGVNAMKVKKGGERGARVTSQSLDAFKDDH